MLPRNMTVHLTRFNQTMIGCHIPQSVVRIDHQGKSYIMILFIGRLFDFKSLFRQGIEPLTTFLQCQKESPYFFNFAIYDFV